MTLREEVRRGVGIAAAVVAALIGAAAADARPAVRVTVGSVSDATFPQNRQNEPAVAIDPVHPQLVAAGANDWLDAAPCPAGDTSGCEPAAAVGGSGVYFSTDGGSTWVQPQYSGLTTRDCVLRARCEPHLGPIGTLPHFADQGLVSVGDPSLAFGPAPDGHGGFSWAAGSRLYYATLAGRIGSPNQDGLDESFSVAVSSTDDLARAAAGHDDAWTPPALAAIPEEGHTYDKDAIWADNAATSPYFGDVYACAASFGGYNGDAVGVFRSVDGGAAWSRAAVLPSPTGMVWQGCALRTDSHGVLYVFWLQMSLWGPTSQLMLTRSRDGGTHFSPPVVLASVAQVGLRDPVAGGLTFSGVGGARTNNMPSVDIANGAPSGADATNEIVVAWTNGPTPRAPAGKRNERVAVLYSRNGGTKWSSTAGATPPADRPDMPAVALSPDGRDLFLVYDNFLQPWEPSTARRPQLMHGVVRHATIGMNGRPMGWADLDRGPAGDVRATSSPSLQAAFIGDYNAVAAVRGGAVALWNDVRAAADCPAVDRYRQAIANGRSPWAPSPAIACPSGFGNSDIFGAALGSAP